MLPLKKRATSEAGEKVKSESFVVKIPLDKLSYVLKVSVPINIYKKSSVSTFCQLQCRTKTLLETPKGYYSIYI